MTTMSNGVARRFTERGMLKVRNRYSEILGTKTLQLLTMAELFDDQFSTPIGQEEMTSYGGASRVGLLSMVEKQLGSQHVKDYTDVGMWTWMAAYHFDHLRSVKKDGTVKGASLRIIQESDWKWPRHLWLARWPTITKEPLGAPIQSISSQTGWSNSPNDKTRFS